MKRKRKETCEETIWRIRLRQPLDGLTEIEKQIIADELRERLSTLTPTRERENAINQTAGSRVKDTRTARTN